MRQLCSALFALTAVYCFQQPAWAQSSDGPNLVDLTDEPSRAELFKLITAAAKAENPPTPSETLSFNLYGPFVFPSDATYDVVLGKPRTNSIFGIDISHYTRPDIPFGSLAQWHVKFVYTKATQGTGYKDGKFTPFWKAMGQLTGSARVHRGAYHFLSSNQQQSGLDQAKTFVAFLLANGGLADTDMPPVLDLEWDKASADGPDRWAGQDPDRIVDKVIAWLEYVEKETKRTPLLYTARSWWRSINAEPKFARLAKYKVWTADYSKTSRADEVPTVPQGASAPLWQFTESARLASNFQGTVDANIYKNTEANFYTDFGVKPFN